MTSGNRLMSYAVQSLALLYPDIELIYRDFTCPNPHEFARLVYDAFPPCSGKYRGNETAAACNVNWDFLYDREVYGNDMGTFWKHLCPA